MRAVLAAVILSLPAPVAATEFYCLATGAVNWNVVPLTTILATEDEHGFSGWPEFWVDIESGEWRGCNVGSRALYSEGGTYRVLADGSAYRQHWVGQMEHGGFASLRIDLTRDPMTFMRADRDGFVETGTCIETEGRRFLDGREIAE